MSYDYVKKAYGVTPVVGERVRHTEIDKLGTIAREKPSARHHVQVKFDGERHASPCHPTALEYLGAEAPQPSEDREIILALFNPRSDHGDGCLFKNNRNLPCQCGFAESVGHYRWALRRAREIAAAHHGVAFEAHGPSKEDEPAYPDGLQP